MIEFGLNWALSTNFYESMEKWDLSFIFIPIFKFWTIQLHKSTVSWLKTASMCLLVREDSFGKDLGDYRNKLEWSTVPVWLLWKVHCSNFGWRHLPTKAFAPNPCWPIRLTCGLVSPLLSSLTALKNTLIAVGWRWFGGSWKIMLKFANIVRARFWN